MEDSPTRTTERSALTGVASAAGAFAIWGVLLVYWKALDAASAYEITAHRIVWALVTAAALLTWTRRWGELRREIARPAGLAWTVVRSVLLSGNWLVFVWGVNHGRVLECSLGYFINPLVSVLLGRVVLGERLRVVQVAAIALATAGVVVLFARDLTVPWIALLLAGTFASYGLLRKTSRAESLPGLVGETAIAFVPAVAYLVWLEAGAGCAFVHAGARTTALLAGAGAVTALPLLLFAYGARRISLTTVGFLQYLVPSVMFVLGVFAYGERVEGRLLTFALIWAGLAVFSWDGIVAQRRRAREAASGAVAGGQGESREDISSVRSVEG
ncbi:MAG: EamA family transporter RarD [Planctomycetota bacterium]|jgi:chloramphenicol-sensitive protein RarD